LFYEFAGRDLILQAVDKLSEMIAGLFGPES
jgi:hypothetical protein